MRRPFVLLLGFVLLAAACASSAPPRLQRPRRPAASATRLGVDRHRNLRDFWIQDVSFVDPRHGWALGYFAVPSPGLLTMQRTEDGGRSWYLVAPPTTLPGRPVTHVRFANRLDGWAFGPALYATHDGGSTWARERLGGPVLALEPAGSSAWAVAGGRLWKSAVGTGRWGPMRGTPEIAGGSVELLRMSLRSGVLWWQSGTGPGHMAGTRNGGRSWSRMPVPCGRFQDEEKLAAARGTLWLVCGNIPGAGSEEKRLYVSRDHGRSWVDRGWAPYNGYDVILTATSDTRAWFADIGSPLLLTTDSGHRWSSVVSPVEDSGWSSIGFLNRRGWVTDRDTLYRTIDRGRHWTHFSITPSTCGCIHRVGSP